MASYTEPEWLEYFLEVATEEWNRRSQLRYRCYQKQPFTLTFLSAEVVKKQQYLKLLIFKLQGLKRGSDFRLFDQIKAKLLGIEQKTIDEVIDEMIEFIKKP